MHGCHGHSQTSDNGVCPTDGALATDEAALPCCWLRPTAPFVSSFASMLCTYSTTAVHSSTFPTVSPLNQLHITVHCTAYVRVVVHTTAVVRSTAASSATYSTSVACNSSLLLFLIPPAPPPPSVVVCPHRTAHHILNHAVPHENHLLTAPLVLYPLLLDVPSLGGDQLCASRSLLVCSSPACTARLSLHADW